MAGGYGTIEEFLEVLTLRNLGYHDKEIVMLNTNGFFDDLITFFDKMTDSGFARQPCRKCFHIVSQPDEVLKCLGVGE